MLTKIVKFIINILYNIFFNYTLIDLKAFFFKYISLSFLISFNKYVIY